MSNEVLSEVVSEVTKLREHGERKHDTRVVGSSERVLSLLSQLGRHERRVSPPGLVSIGEAIKVSGKSRNTIKGWVQRKLLDGYRSRSNHELFVPRDQLLHLLDMAPVRDRIPVTNWPRPSQGLDVKPKRPVSRHRLAELRSLAMHRRLATILEDDPVALEKARNRVRRWLDGSEYFTGSTTYANRWWELLSGPRQQLLEVLTSDNEESRALRQSTPFAGILSERERKAIMDEVVARVD
jgi:hypothetical protein